MAEFRLYEATTGSCIAGDRWTELGNEKHRVRADFAAGVRLVVDDVRGEIRGFVPGNRGTQEAFYAVLSRQGDETPDTAAFTTAVRDLFEETSNWSLRYDTPEGQLLVALAEPMSAGTLAVEGSLRSENCVRFGTPDPETAGTQVRLLRSRADSDRRYVVSLSKTVDHLHYDLLVHLAGGYDGVTLIGS